MKRFLIFLLYFKLCFCGFFDDIDDPLELLWNNRPFYQTSKFTECRTFLPYGPKFGVCQNPSVCMLSGGRPNGICGTFQTCCTYENTCGEVKNQKVSYFHSSHNEYRSKECKYDIFLINENICQVRLDFEVFNLAPSVQIGGFSMCESDKLQIFPNLYNIPELCGNNDNQHVYVHVNQTTGTKKVTLNMLTLSNYPHSWKIKVTQLECPGERNTKDVANDFHTLAPLGAIQHHTEPHGEIKSFGFDGIRFLNSYTSQEKYAISFRKLSGFCGIRFETNYLKLHEDCNQDFLYIPFLRTHNSSDGSEVKICGSEGTIFESLAPGPLTIYFHSSLGPKNLEPHAFYLKYELMTSCYY